MNEYLSAQERLSVDKTTSPEPITTCIHLIIPPFLVQIITVKIPPVKIHIPTFFESSDKNKEV